MVELRRALPLVVSMLAASAAAQTPEEPAKDRPERERLIESLNARELYWADRIGYPTGRFDARWLLESYEQDRRVPRAVPSGSIAPRSPGSPLALDPLQFTALGPLPLQMNGCLGCYAYGHASGRVNTIAIDPVTPNVAYMGPVGGGVWKTTNCCTTATTWAPVTDSPMIPTLATDDITLDPNDHNVVYAGTGDLNFGSFSMGSAGILKSTDQGAAWTVKGANVFTAFYPPSAGGFPQYQAVGKVKVDPNNSNIVIAGTKTGLFFSYDGGDNWAGPCTTNSFSTQRQDVTGLLVADAGATTDLYVAIGTRGFSTTVQPDLGQNGANGMYKTTLPASGCPASWTAQTSGWPAGTAGGTPYPTNTLGRIDLAMAPNNPQIIYAQVQAIPTRGQLGVWRTTNGGTTWTLRSGVAGLTGCDGDYPQNWYNQGMAVDPNNSDVVFLDTHDIWKSTNGGTTFVDQTCGYAGGTTVHVDQHALTFLPGSSSVLLAGSDGGIYVSTNATANPAPFTQINDTVNTIEFYSGDITMDFANSASPGINAGAQDNGSSTFVWSGNPTAAMWQLRRGGDGMYAKIEPKQALRWYQEYQNGVIGVSTTGPDGGQANATGGWGADRLSFVFPYEMDKFNCPAATCNHMVAGSYRVWETLTGAVPNTWTAVSPDLTKNTLADRSFINQLAFAPTDTTVVAVGTNDGNVQYGTNLNTGAMGTWTNITLGNAVLPNRPILDVALSPTSATTVYAAVGGFDQNSPATPGHVFMATCSSGCTTPANWTWADKSGNFPNIPADSIVANPRWVGGSGEQQVFVGTDWGLYFTNDINAATPVWLKFTSGLASVMIWDMAIDRGAGGNPLTSSTTLALFTRSRGAFAWPLPDGPIVPVELQGFSIE